MLGTGTVNPSDLYTVLLISTGVLLAGVAAVRVSTRAGLPSLLLYLAIGLALGESGVYTVEDLAGCATDDLVVFPPRWDATEHTFNPSQVTNFRLQFTNLAGFACTAAEPRPARPTASPVALGRTHARPAGA